MKATWTYGNVFLMGVAATLLWVKWSGRWNEPKTQFVTSSESETTNLVTKDDTVSVPDMVEILKSPEAIDKLKDGYIPKFLNGKFTAWEKTPAKVTIKNTLPETIQKGSLGN